MSFVNKFENQDRFIEAFIQEDWHPVPKPVKTVFDKNSNLLLHSVPPTEIKPNFKSRIYSSSCFSPFPSSFSLLIPPPIPLLSPPPIDYRGEARKHKEERRKKRNSVPDVKVSAEPDES